VRTITPASAGAFSANRQAVFVMGVCSIGPQDVWCTGQDENENWFLVLIRPRHFGGGLGD
jgi:hypothetical protein